MLSAQTHRKFPDQNHFGKLGMRGFYMALAVALTYAAPVSAEPSSSTPPVVSAPSGPYKTRAASVQLPYSNLDVFRLLTRQPVPDETVTLTAPPEIPVAPPLSITTNQDLETSPSSGRRVESFFGK